MKLRLSATMLLCAFALPAMANHASANMGNAMSPSKIYFGVIGGGGSSGNFHASQYATAFYTEAQGGPLAVNAFGNMRNQSTSLFGAQLGFQAHTISPGPSTLWTFGPAGELEAITMNTNTLNGELTNNTARLPEHDFMVSYPGSKTVLLANAVLSFNHPRLVVHPYAGLGIGDAIIRVRGATATQIRPMEVGVNHYNSNSSDYNSSFAGQIKLGLYYDINQYVSVFADYRWLYIASTKYIFGSTVYPAHVPTSSWQVAMDAQKYNLGNVGIRVNV